MRLPRKGMSVRLLDGTSSIVRSLDAGKVYTVKSHHLDEETRTWSVMFFESSGARHHWGDFEAVGENSVQRCRERYDFMTLSERLGVKECEAMRAIWAKLSEDESQREQYEYLQSVSG